MNKYFMQKLIMTKINKNEIIIDKIKMVNIIMKK
jgi:hypothetical protein